MIVIGQPGFICTVRGFLFFLLLITTFVCCVRCRLNRQSQYQCIVRLVAGGEDFLPTGLPLWGLPSRVGTKAGATVIQSKDALGRDIECLSWYQMTGAQTGIAQCNQTEKVPRYGYSMSYRALSISSPMTPCAVVTFPHLVPSKSISKGPPILSPPTASLAFCSLTAGFQVSLRKALRSTRWYLLRVALCCMPRTVPKV